MDAATVVWLPSGGAAEHAEAPAQPRRALEEWARARGIRLVEAEEVSGPALVVDLTVADRVEEELTRAHDAVTADDASLAEHALARAEGLLRSHPELPNAAWLMAEVHRGWSARWARVAPADVERAARAWRRAGVLDGGRAAGVGETSVPTEPPVIASLILEGEGSLRIDGTAATEGALRLGAGEHLLTVTRHGLPVWSEWVTVASGTEIRVAIPDPPPCSREDLERASIKAGEVLARGVRCTSWVAAAPGLSEVPGTGAVRVATCEGSHCGALVEWRVGGHKGEPPTADGHTPRRFPVWATWTIVGVVVAAAAVGVTLAATGAFHSSPETQFVSGGQR